MDARTSKKMDVRLILGLGLAGFVVFFTLQNAETVELRFLIWTLSAPRAVMVLGVLAIGIVIGWILHSWLGHHKSSMPASSAASSASSQPILSNTESQA